MPKYPSILIIVYDRFDHFKRCVEALQRCVDAKKYSVFVASDGPRDGCAKQKIKKIRQYCKTVEGFSKFTVFERRKNLGLLSNSITASDYLFEMDERLIVIEDDVVVGKYFLRYVTEGLNKFRENENIVGICSQLPVEFHGQFSQPFFWSKRVPYAVGVWKRGERFMDKILNPDPSPYFRRLLSSRERLWRILTSYPYLLKPIILIASGRFRAPDAERSVVMTEYGLLALYPPYSLVNHMGNDGTGLHAPKNSMLQDRPISDKPVFFQDPIEIGEHEKIHSKNHFNCQSWKFRFIFEVVYWVLKMVPSLTVFLFYMRKIKKKLQKSI